jgi:hypothetical protein
VWQITRWRPAKNLPIQRSFGLILDLANSA